MGHIFYLGAVYLTLNHLLANMCGPANHTLIFLFINGLTKILLAKGIKFHLLPNKRKIQTWTPCMTHNLYKTLRLCFFFSVSGGNMRPMHLILLFFLFGPTNSTKSS